MTTSVVITTINIINTESLLFFAQRKHLKEAASLYAPRAQAAHKGAEGS